MNCEKAWELLSLQMDGALTPEEQTALEAHLESCPDCRKRKEELLAAEAAFKDCQAEAPAALHSRVMDAVRQEAKQKKSSRKQWFTVGIVAAAAAAVAILAGVGLLQMPGTANGVNAVSIAGAFSRLEISTEFAPEDAAEEAMAQEYAEKNGCPVLVIWQDGETVRLPGKKTEMEERPGLTILFTTNRKLNELAAQQKQNRVRLYVPEGADERKDAPAVILIYQ